MQDITQAAAAATALRASSAAEHIASLFVADAALRRICEVLDYSTLTPAPGFTLPSIPPAVLQLLLDDISERMASYVHDLLLGQEVQP